MFIADYNSSSAVSISPTEQWTSPGFQNRILHVDLKVGKILHDDPSLAWKVTDGYAG